MKKRLLASLLSLCLIVGLLPTAALAVDETPDGETPVACAGLEGCVEDTHDEGCPLYVAPEEPVDEPDGDKNNYYETDDVYDNETINAVIAALYPAEPLEDGITGRVHKKIRGISPPRAMATMSPPI